MWVFEPGKCVKNFGGTKKKALGRDSLLREVKSRGHGTSLAPNSPGLLISPRASSRVFNLSLLFYGSAWLLCEVQTPGLGSVLGGSRGVSVCLASVPGSGLRTTA